MQRGMECLRAQLLANPALACESVCYIWGGRMREQPADERNDSHSQLSDWALSFQSRLPPTCEGHSLAFGEKLATCPRRDHSRTLLTILGVGWRATFCLFTSRFGGSAARSVDAIWVCATLEKQIHEADVAEVASNMERGAAVCDGFLVSVIVMHQRCQVNVTSRFEQLCHCIDETRL
jgi:hypothetical protein